MFSATVFVSLCFSKQLLHSVFAISVIIKVSRLVFKHVPALAGNASSHIAETDSNNCFRYGGQ